MSKRQPRTATTAPTSAKVRGVKLERVAPTSPSSGGAVRVRLGSHERVLDPTTVQLLSFVLALVVFGLVMVLSSSAVEQFAAGENFSGKFIKQLITAMIGLPFLVIAMRQPAAIWRKLATPAILLALLLELLVFTPLGYSVGENRAWLSIGGFTFQPAEATKTALIIWIAKFFDDHRGKLDRLMNYAPKLVIWLGVIIGPIIIGKDLGTTMVIGALVLGGMWFGGVPLRHIGIAVGAAVAGALALASTSSIRVARMTSFFTGQCDYEDLCWQTSHGLYALAAGGIFGQGLGNSRAKWSWLPEADNDFIFAIIGEEVGMLGCLGVIALFVGLIVVLVKVIGHSRTTFTRTAVGAFLVWIAFQAFVNIAVVLGLLPVLGVPLPFVSSGGSALITTMLAVGIVLSLAKEQPTRTSPERTRTR